MEFGINTFRCPIDVCVSFDELKNKADFFNELKSVLLNILNDRTIKKFDEKVGILDIMNKPGFLRCALVSCDFSPRISSGSCKLNRISDRFACIPRNFQDFYRFRFHQRISENRIVGKLISRVSLRKNAIQHFMQFENLCQKLVPFCSALMDSSIMLNQNWLTALIACNHFVRNAPQNGPAVTHKSVVHQLAMEATICKCIPMQPARNASTDIFWSEVDACISHAARY